MRAAQISLVFCLTMLLCFAAPAAQAAHDSIEAQSITLPAPDKQGGMPLMQALAERKANRSFSDKPVSEKILGDLLWATWGVNRPDGRRTAPTARNTQQVEVLVLLENGAWRYDGINHKLLFVTRDDLRAKAGGAPIVLLYAAPDENWARMHVGSLYQNAGLYCASAKLACVARASGADAFSSDELKLPVGYKVHITQSVGWPR
jgi:hypothetical protein